LRQIQIQASYNYNRFPHKKAPVIKNGRDAIAVSPIKMKTNINGSVFVSLPARLQLAPDEYARPPTPWWLLAIAYETARVNPHSRLARPFRSRSPNRTVGRVARKLLRVGPRSPAKHTEQHQHGWMPYAFRVKHVASSTPFSSASRTRKPGIRKIAVFQIFSNCEVHCGAQSGVCAAAMLQHLESDMC